MIKNECRLTRLLIIGIISINFHLRIHMQDVLTLPLASFASQANTTHLRIGLSMCPFIGLVMDIINQPYDYFCCLDSPVRILTRKMIVLTDDLDSHQRGEKSAKAIINLRRMGAGLKTAPGNPVDAAVERERLEQRQKDEAEEKSHHDSALKIQNVDIPKLESEINSKKTIERVYSQCCLRSTISSLIVVVSLVALNVISLSVTTSCVMFYLAVKIVSLSCAIKSFQRTA